MTAANKITFLRILLVPVFMVFLLRDMWYISAAIFLIAAITDGVDGYIARKYQQITTLGKIIDPLADKLLVTAALIGLVWLQRLNPWFALIIISREFVVTSLRIVAISKGTVIAAATSGKLKTVTQITAIVVMLYNGVYKFSVGGILWSDIFMAAAVIITVYSGVEYIIANRDKLKEA
ncbi:MAG: CDP-diacylglycerol--glycerol-3-phosphate 3-phosphatidyltransferase [Firmicutes bacterium]|nr:CDP-diacylglycerol--glycerol-3-phosphate 3-phosphatidyltransferase [Bacillota bacterium]